jgi:hypothetical protein
VTPTTTLTRRLLDRFDRDGQWRALQTAQHAIDDNQEREIAAAGIDEEEGIFYRQAPQAPIVSSFGLEDASAECLD